MRDIVLNIISAVVALAVAAIVVICVGTSDGSLTDKVTMFSAIGAMLFAGVIFFTVFFFEELIITNITADIDAGKIIKEQEKRIKSNVLDLNKETKK